jgi:hypothetical protein
MVDKTPLTKRALQVKLSPSNEPPIATATALFDIPPHITKITGR